MTQTRAPLDSFLIVAVLGLLVWLPLPLGSNREWSGMLFVLLTAALTGIWAFANLNKARLNNKALKPALPLFGLLLLTQAWVASQVISGSSVDSGASWHDLLLGCGYSLLFLLTVGLFHTRRRLTLLLTVLVISGALQAFYGSFMTLSKIEWLLFGPKTSYQGNATGTFVNRNHLAGYLELTLACGIGLLLALRDGRELSWRSLVELLVGPKARLRLALIVMVIGLVMSHSRMGNTAFFASLLIVGGIFIMLNKEHRLRNGLILASIILIDMLVISQYFGLEKLKDRLVNTQLEDRIVNGEVVQRANELRDDVFASTLPMIEQNLFTGSGAGSFEAVYGQYPGQHIRLHFDHAHNDYLQFLAEFGLIGTLTLALFVLICLGYALKALFRRESWYRSGIGFATSMGILALLIHASTDFNLQIPANAATYLVICACALLANHHSKTRNKKRRNTAL